MKRNKQKSITPARKRRMAFHILSGTFVLIAANLFYDRVRLFLFLLLISGILLSLLSLKFRLPFIYPMLKKFEAPKYMNKFPGKGAIFLVAGCLLTLRLFSKEHALASIAILTFADPASHLFGVTFGRIKHRKPFNRLKNIEGTLAGILTGFLAANLFAPALASFLAASVSMLAEALTIKLGGDSVDDNLIVPLSAGTTLHLLNRFFM